MAEEIINSLVYTPYCKKCGACGEEGCCSMTNCFSFLTEDTECKYGQSYLMDAIVYKQEAYLAYDIFYRLELSEITAEEAVKEFKEKSVNLFQEVRSKYCGEEEESI